MLNKLMHITAVLLLTLSFGYPAGAETEMSNIPPLMPNPVIRQGNWYLIRADYLPPVPVGWQIVDMIPLLSGGTTQSAVQMFLHNPTSGQNAVWLVGL